MKKNKSENLDILFKKTKQNFVKMFKLEKSLYKKCIRSLIDLEIVKKSTEKIEYIP